MLGARPRAPTRAVEVAAAAAAALLSPVAASPGLFDVDFDKDPAPLAEHALRNKAYLPAQICGIVGAYIVCVLVVGIGLLTYGRRMRRSAHDRFDMVKVNQLNGFEMTPVSPSSSTRRWWPQSPKIKHASRKSQGSINGPPSVPTSPISPGAESMSSFDQNFLRSQQEERQREMERLYAAVMEHDDQKQRKKSLRASAEEADGSRDDKFSPAPSAQRSDLRRLVINTSTSLAVPHHQGQHPASPTSPGTPRSPIRAIYPPESPMAAARRSNYAGPVPPPLKDNAAAPPPDKHRPSSPRNFLGRNRTPSLSSTGSKSRRSVRNLRISNPIARYPGAVDDEARTPLSPRFYNPGPPPPTPPSATTAATPTTPGTADSLGPFRYEDLDRPRPLPRADPQRSNSQRHSQQRSSSGSGNGVTFADEPLPPPPNRAHPSRSAASSTSTLPLRNMMPESTQAPGTTKTTVIESRRRERDIMSPGRLRTPATGVPMTPYSPYMPFTPVTPVTPHLVSRKERKARQKEEKKMRPALDEEDEVADLDWGNAY